MRRHPTLGDQLNYLPCRSVSIACALISFIPAGARADHSLATPGALAGAVSTVGADTLAPGQWAAGVRMTYDLPRDRDDAELIELASHHVHAHNADWTGRATLSLAYGAADHLTLTASLPYVHRDGLRAGEHSHVGGAAVNEVVELGSAGGFGDLTLGAQYLLAHDHDAGWGVALIGGIKLPTGSTHRRSDEGERLETEHQPGSGSWDPYAGVALSKQWSATRLDANLLYQATSRGAQRTELGDRAVASAALSRSLGTAGDGEDHADGGWSLSLEGIGEWEKRQRVDGELERDSGGKVAWIAPGVRYTAASGWSAATSLAVPVWQDIRPSHPDNRLRLTLSLGRAF